MSEKEGEDSIEDVFNEIEEDSSNQTSSSSNNSITSREDYDQFIEENYDQLEAIVDYKKEQLNKDQEKDQPLIDEEEKKQKQNWLESREHRIEVGQELKNIAQEQYPHKLHDQGAFALSGLLVSMGFLYDNVFHQLGILGGIIALKSALSFQEGNKYHSKLPKLINNHPIYYLMGGIVFTALFLSAGYSLPADIHMGLVADILAKVLFAMFGRV